MRPVIAMPQMGHELFREYMKSKYVISLLRAGAKVRWIEIDDPEKAVKEALECDGLLLPGGGDIEPSMYGEERIPQCGQPQVIRDAAEPKLFAAFRQANKPILCICRGVQMLNVCCGGTLNQDIKPTQKCEHSDFKGRAKGLTHRVKVHKGTMLYDIFGEEDICVNSMHHQAAKDIGMGLVEGARSEDGYIEALELMDYPFCVGVQWHPEHMSARSKMQRKLFTAFVKACKK